MEAAHDSWRQDVVERRVKHLNLRLKIGEWLQVVLGFAIPILLARHVVGNRLAHDLFGTATNNYTYVLWVLFVNSPWHGAHSFL